MSPGGGSAVNLVPGAAFMEYRLVEPIKVVSGEADLWVAMDGGGRSEKKAGSSSAI